MDSNIQRAGTPITITPFETEKTFYVNGKSHTMRLVKPIDKELVPTCQICLEFPEDAVSLCSKKHFLCRDCCRAALEICPSCRAPGRWQDRSHDPAIVTIQNLPYLCPVGCQSKIEEADLAKHVATCKPFDCGDCDYKGTQFAVDEHKRKFCPESVMVCSSCCSQIKRRDLEGHTEKCPEVEVETTLPKVGSVHLKRRQVEALEAAFQKSFEEERMVSHSESKETVSREAFNTLLKVYDQLKVDKLSKPEAAAIQKVTTKHPKEIFTYEFNRETRWNSKTEVLEKIAITTCEGKNYYLSVAMDTNPGNYLDRYTGFELKVAPRKEGEIHPVMVGDIVNVEVHAIAPCTDRGLWKTFTFSLSHLLKGDCDFQKNGLKKLFNWDMVKSVHHGQSAYVVKIIV